MNKERGLCVRWVCGWIEREKHTQSSLLLPSLPPTWPRGERGANPPTHPLPTASKSNSVVMTGEEEEEEEEEEKEERLVRGAAEETA